MATLLDLPNELLIYICERIWPDDDRARYYQLLPIKWLYWTCKRFGFLADLRYLVLEGRCHKRAFTAFTLDYREDGPSYWLDDDFVYCGYSEYRLGLCLCKAYIAVTDSDEYAYCIGSSAYADNEYRESIYYAIVYGMYEGAPLPADVAEFLQARPRGASTQRVLIAPRFPLVPYVIDPVLHAELERAPSGEAREVLKLESH